jgi:hypothetical protein
MRKLLLLILSMAMIGGGFWLLGLELFAANIIWGRAVMAGVMLLALGIYLLWADFIAPLFGFKGKGAKKKIKNWRLR